jgi:vancomycin resistance protein YoaR
MNKLQQQNQRKWRQVITYFGLGALVGLLLLIGVMRLTWHNKFYPGITIAKVPVGGLTREEAENKIKLASDNYQTQLSFNGHTWETPKGALKVETEASLNKAYSYGRRLMFGDYLLLLINRKSNFPLELSAGQTEVMEELINELASVIEITPIDPRIEVISNKILVTDGSDGVLLDNEKLESKLRDAQSQLNSTSIEIPTTVAKRQLSEEQLAVIKARAETLLNKKVELVLDDTKVQLAGENLIAMLSTNEVGVVNEAVINEYVRGLSESMNKAPQDAKFDFRDGKVQEFAAGKDGLTVKVEESAIALKQAIDKLLNSEESSQTVQVAAERTSPKVTTDKVNELGIKERIGRGESYYAHSIQNRIYNVGLASERANSALIPPGEEFSFNKTVGDISGASGYRAAYVISGGRTVLGDGGGVCQVSTTLFRAAMNAGLPITERWAHAYRVGYYEQNSKPGVDATVYAPSKDLRFKNDTPGHILVQLTNDPKNLHLVVEIYGTNDGRIATVTEPKVWGISPPPPDIIQEDPTLPAGTRKQVDWSAWGAKTSFEYKVVRNGEVLQERTFNSSFKPWANVYLVGTGQ